MKTDNFGNELAVGDFVVFMGTAGRSSKPELLRGRVIGFTPKGVNVQHFVETWKYGGVTAETPGAFSHKQYNPETGNYDKAVYYLKVKAPKVMNRAQSDIVKEVPREAEA